MHYWLVVGGFVLCLLLTGLGLGWVLEWLNDLWLGFDYLVAVLVVCGVLFGQFWLVCVCGCEFVVFVFIINVNSVVV